jgi:molecular chaperone HtpG
MAGLLLADSAHFQEWLAIYREQFFRYLLSALQILSDYFQNVGNFELAQQYARRLVSLDPLDESTHQRLMYILAISGKRAAAIEQFQICRRTLRTEIGVEPSSETLAVYEKIRSGQEILFKPVTGGLRRVNLPAQFTTFVGRDAELEWLAESLGNPTKRLITLVGMGGVGKTRLALQAAEKHAEEFPDGVRFVALEHITSTDLLVPSIAQAVGLFFRGDAEPHKQLLRFLRPMRALIIIDNAEHMLDQMPFFMNILQQAPGVKLLLTSRWRLNYQAASVLEIKGLPYPADLQDAQALTYPAVKLFINRAVHNQADFSFTDKDVPIIVQICRLADGLPLALELAASRIREFSCEQIAVELQHGLDILKAALLDIPERHRSISMAFDPCWQRLSAIERLVFQRLSVFQNAFSLEAAQFIAGASLPMLSQFMDHSLLKGDATRGFSLSPLLKNYAAEKLLENPEEQERVRDLHSHYYVEYLHQGNTRLREGNGSRQLIREIDSQIDNIRAALSRASFRRQTDTFTKGMDALQRFYELRNEYRQTRPIETARLTPEKGKMNMSTPQTIPFKAETRQLLDILIHSLYIEREIFLRELISNASDALTRMDFEMLTNRNVLDAEAPLAIRIIPDAEKNTLTITDAGIGMTLAEITENLGTIAHSGARAFVEIAQKGGANVNNVIGQFGVGFYSAFMVAEKIRVESRSFRPEAQAVTWESDGSDMFTVMAGDLATRGTQVILTLRPDAAEFLQEARLKQIITRHSDFIPFPIYVGDSQEQVNRQTAIWRQSTREVAADEYHAFYRQMTLDPAAPLTYGHLSVDAPVQMYAVLFIPAQTDRGLLSPRSEDGLKLYARKVLIQEYCKDLLPQYFGFVQGVVDSEDLPLNVSRETVQSNRIMANLKKLVTNKVIDMLNRLAADEPEKYAAFWHEFGRFIKEGVAVEMLDADKLYPLLRFHTINNLSAWVSLDQYIEQKKPDQEAIYYILGDDERSVSYSPHLDVIRRYAYDVLVMTDPVDAFMLTRLNKYKDLPLVNVANADLKMPEPPAVEPENAPAALTDEASAPLVARFKNILGDRVADVRMTDRLSDSPARLVDPEGGPSQQLQRMYRLLKQDFVAPKKVLELNPHHAILVQLSALPEGSPLIPLIVEQVYENTLLIEGLHPDPAGMIQRIQKLMEEALEK